MPSHAELKRARKAYDALQAQKAKYAAVLREVFPVGCLVHYEHGDHLITAMVVEHGYRSGMFVEGRTGKRYHIDASRFFMRYSTKC